MKLYEKRNNKSQNTCSYCRHEGHNKRYCPTLRRHWEANKDWDKHPDLSLLKDVKGSDFGGYWKFTDHDARRVFQWHFNYINKLMTTPKKTPRKRKATKCGFCGSSGHTRRNCSLMGEFVKALEETNKAYRKSFYETVFVEHGLGIGAFVQYSQYIYNPANRPSDDPTSLITDIDFDSISIGNLFNRWSDWNTELQVKYRVGGHEKNFGTDLFLDSEFPLLNRNGMGHLSDHYSGITKVIAPAPSLPDKEWFLGQSPAFKWIVKKKSLHTLFATYGSAIMRHHPDGEALWEEWRKKI